MFHLAETLGRTVAELGQTMSAEEFGEWADYYTLKAEESKKAEKRRR